MLSDHDLRLADGRLLRVYDSGERADALTVLWHNGSPHTGAPIEPLRAATEARGMRLVTYARPSYGGSSPLAGRDVASAAGDVAQIADALGIARLAVLGHSGGGPHALACAALEPELVLGAVVLATPAPFDGSDDWYAGMAAPGALRAASDGPEARRRHAESEEFDPAIFTAADWAALEGAWGALGDDAVRAGENGPDGLIEDDLAFVSPWGFDLGSIEVPVLIVQGGEDRVIPRGHAERLARACPASELWLRGSAGHVSVLEAVPDALDWLRP
jgi:pimeloyl-ACP methyl ester carboxylesterase